MEWRSARAFNEAGDGIKPRDRKKNLIFCPIGRWQGVGAGRAVVIYCQDGETLLLLSRRRAAGHVQARYTSSRLRPSAHVRTGDRKKAMGPYVSRRK